MDVGAADAEVAHLRLSRGCERGQREDRRQQPDLKTFAWIVSHAFTRSA
jgi:hypothetical protein